MKQGGVESGGNTILGKKRRACVSLLWLAGASQHFPHSSVDRGQLCSCLSLSAHSQCPIFPRELPSALPPWPHYKGSSRSSSSAGPAISLLVLAGCLQFDCSRWADPRTGCHFFVRTGLPLSPVFQDLGPSRRRAPPDPPQRLHPASSVVG